VLFRALRGSFTRGLAGMAPVVVAAEALILRPLLGVEPARLRATCIARGAAPLEDPSNQDGRYARTRLRLAPRGDPLPAASALASRRAREDAGVATRLALAARLFPAGCAWLDLALLGSDRTARLALARLLAVVGAAAHAPGEREATALLAAGRGTLGGARLLPGGRWLVREAAALAPPVPATPGVTWDRRFRLRGGVPPGLRLGALGPAPRLRQLAPHLPAAALAALPALLSSDGTPALVPHLRWPSPEACATLALDFVAGEMQIMPVSGYGMPHYLRTEPADGRREDHAT